MCRKTLHAESWAYFSVALFSGTWYLGSANSGYLNYSFFIQTTILIILTLELRSIKE